MDDKGLRDAYNSGRAGGRGGGILHNDDWVEQDAGLLIVNGTGVVGFIDFLSASSLLDLGLFLIIDDQGFIRTRSVCPLFISAASLIVAGNKFRFLNRISQRIAMKVNH